MAANAELWDNPSARVSKFFFALLGDNSNSDPALEASSVFDRVSHIESNAIDGINIYCSDEHWEMSPDLPDSVQKVATQDYLFTSSYWQSCASQGNHVNAYAIDKFVVVCESIWQSIQQNGRPVTSGRKLATWKCHGGRINLRMGNSPLHDSS
jgi:hypothetical protein